MNASDGAVGLAPGSTHAGLKPIRSGARQHLVDADDVERMSADTEMEAFLASGLDKIPGYLVGSLYLAVVNRRGDRLLVGTDTRRFQGFRAELLIFVGHEVNA